MENEDYEPFGDEWKAYMKKQNKDFIIEFAAMNCKKSLERRDALKFVTEAKGLKITDVLCEQIQTAIND